MTIRHLKIFLSVCKNNFNTTKAAEELHITQPAVSFAIKELEQYLDRIVSNLEQTEQALKKGKDVHDGKDKN